MVSKCCGHTYFCHCPFSKLTFFQFFSCSDALTASKLKNSALALVMLCNVGLFFVDHIHFQYNGIMFGILLLSISKICKEKYLQSALLFSILLHMKHIFVYISPAYIVYLLKFYCLRNGAPLISLIKLGAIVGIVTLTSFGPFYDHLIQVRKKCAFEKDGSIGLTTVLSLGTC